MKVGIIQVVGQEEACNLAEKEFEKEISTLEVKRMRIPDVSSTPMAARILVEDNGCDFAVLPYALGEDEEKPGLAFDLSISLAEFWLKRHIFRIMIFPDEDPEKIIPDAVKEVVMYYYKPSQLEREREEKEKEEESTTGLPFQMFGQ